LGVILRFLKIRYFEYLFDFLLHICDRLYVSIVITKLE
jgi:hypothetical protein